MKKVLIFILSLTLFVSVFFMGTTTKADMVETSPESYEYFEEVDLARIVFGFSTSSAITTNGQLFMWGDNRYGTLADGTETDSYSPINVTLNFGLEVGETIVKEDNGDGFSIALTSSGRVFSWGDDYFRGIEIVPPESSLYPTDITTAFALDVEDEIIDIAVGHYHIAVWTSLGELYMWGYNGSGQLGDGTNEDRVTPVNITANLELDIGEGISKISLGEDHSTLVTSMGRIFTWGSNYRGQLGDGTIASTNTPAKIDAYFTFNDGESIADVIAGKIFNMAITTDGRVFTWGDNQYGQLGDGTMVDKLSPSDITSNFGFSDGEYIVQAEAGDGRFIARSNENRLFVWGYNEDANLALGNNLEQPLPVDNTAALDLGLEEEILSISSGEYNSGVITSFGRCLVWGDNDGELGDGTSDTREMPVEIQEKFNLVQVQEYSLEIDELVIDVSVGRDHFAAVTSYGKLYAWGRNNYGQLGDGTLSSSNIPINLTGGLNLELNEKVIDVELGEYFSMAITSNGRIFTWGDNRNGQLGDGSFDYSSVPIELPLSSFDSEMIASIVVNENSAAAITSTGRVFAWGHNENQLIDNGTNSNLNIPHEITSDFVLNVNETVTELSLGGGFAAAITSEGRLFTWGNDNQGKLGNGPVLTADVITPTEIDLAVFGGDTITDISTGYCHTEVVSSSGKLYTWGCNDLYQLGDGTTTYKATPTEIPSSSFADESIVSVHTGLKFSFAITSSGNVYGWGSNDNGQLGEGTRIDKQTPVILSSIADIENIIAIGAGRWSTLAITDTGELFQWGKAADGPMGSESSIRDVEPLQKFLMNSIEAIYVPFENEFYNDTIMVSVFPTYNIGDQLYSITINGVEYLSDDLTISNGRITILIDNTGVLDDRFDIVLDSISFVEGVDVPAIGTVYNQTMLHDFEVPTFDVIETQTMEVGQSGFDWTVEMENVVDNSDTTIILEETEDNIDYDTLGTYTVSVKATDASMNETSQTFDVEVVDTIAPIIYLTGASTVRVEVGDSYTDAGATYTDNYDEPGYALTAGDTVDASTIGTYTVLYNFTDTSGNIATTASRTVIVQDTAAPRVTGVANDEVYEKGSEVTITFNEGTATLNDEEFESGTVVTEAGDYTLVVRDASGNSTTTSFVIESGSSVVLIIIIIVAVVAIGAGGFLLAKKYLIKV